MPRRLLGVFILLLVSVFTMQAQGDAVLFTVGSEPVHKSEFEYRLAKSLDKSGDVLLQTWIRFKQKVQWAKELGLDTLEVFRRQKECYQQMMVGSMEHTGGGKRLSSAGEWVKLKHITCPLRQHSGKKQEREAKRQLDSLYQALEKGTEVTWEMLPWTQSRHLLAEWQTQLAGLDKGKPAKPFLSPLGVHIIAWTDKRTGTPEKDGTSPSASRFRLKELEEALLVVRLEDYLDKNLSMTESELETYFNQHREDYGWGTPHYKGAVIHCQDKKEAKRVMKYLKKYPEELWQEAWTRMPAEVSSGCLLETGLFAIGENPFIDKLVFKCGEFQPKEDYPYVFVLGKKMKKGPVNYKDVSGKVEKDYRKVKKEAEMEAFLQKYRVEIDEEVLKTVNRCGNK